MDGDSVTGTTINDHDGTGTGTVEIKGTVTLTDGASIDGGDVTIVASAFLQITDTVGADTDATLSNDTVTNTGTITVDALAVLALDTTFIDGGIITGAGSIHVTGDSTID